MFFDMNSFLKLDEKQKVLFFINVAKRCIPFIIDSEQVAIIKDVLECCSKQVLNNELNGEVLYDFLDNEDNGITVLAEMSEDEKESAAWNCIIDAIAFSSRYAYDAENAKYYPEPIALVDNRLIEHLMKCYYECVSDEKYIENLFEKLSQDDVSNITFE